MTAVLSIPLIPHSAEADECGAVSAAKTVTCAAATYGGTSAAPNPIEYTGQTGGLTLTVKPSGEMTTIKSFLPPDDDTRYNGIKVVGRGTLAVKLEGKVRIVNEAGGWTSPTEATFTDRDGTTGTATFIDPQYRFGSRNYGIWVQGDQAGDSNREDKIEIVIGADAKVGSEEVPIGRNGILAYYSSSTAEGDVSIVNRGEVHGYYTGIWVLHEGSGDIAVETAEGSVTSKGILVDHDNSEVGGDVRVTNHGTIRSLEQRPLYAKTLTGEAGSKVAESWDIAEQDYASEQGILVLHKDFATGTAASPSSEIAIVSSGDIDAISDGINITTKGDESASQDSVVPVTIKVTGGAIKSESGYGIQVDHRYHFGGIVTVDLAGEIAQTGNSEGEIRDDGINIFRISSNDGSSDVNRDTEVTLRPGARIGMDGDAPTVGGRGVFINHTIHGGAVRVTLESGAMIGTAATPVGEHGVFVKTGSANDEVDIRITNEGLIHAKGSGVVALNVGWGDVVVEHLKGEIIAGDAPDIFDELVEDHQTQLADLKGRTAGVLAMHGGQQIQTLEGKTFDGNDPATHTAKIGEIKIASKADITSKGDGILAYVKDLSDSGNATIIPIKIDVSGGTITADGHGVHAEIATTYTEMEAPTAGKISVTVGEMATIRAKKDGVHVKGMRTFASDHARKGQYDQTVTINGKVMGGAGEHAGVRMVNGGTLVIGPKAEISATSGIAVSADKALHVTLKENAHGQIAFVKGKFLNSGDKTPNVFQRESTAGMAKTIAVGDAVKATSGKTGTHGVYDAVFERMVTLKSITGGHQFQVDSEKEISRTYHARARVYEALPSVLLEMSAPGGRQARLSATRDGGGAWARVLASDGEREADMSTTEMDDAGRALSWDFERWGVETGFVVPTDAPGLMLGVSAHYRDGEADVERGGKIEVSGVGVGVSATWRGEDGWYADGELSYTRFEDVDLSSETRGMVASGLDGEGHAIGVEVGRRMEMDGFALIPRGGLTWTWVDIDGFDDVSGVTGSGRVSFRSEDSARARVGVLLENGETYASLDVERELSESRDVTASGSRLRSEVESTWARIGVGGVMALDAQGESTLSADAHYAASDGDNHDYGASVLLKVRF